MYTVTSHCIVCVRFHIFALKVGLLRELLSLLLALLMRILFLVLSPL
jgi:hypothetical protein